jgi:post-segregation antitoxin (ccd killing protein)
VSLLSDTNHTPQRVFALLRLLEAQRGELDFETIRTWFKPEVRESDQRSSEDVNIRQMLGAATSLGTIELAGQNLYRLNGRCPKSLESFADLVHDRLAAADKDHPDSIVLEAFAAMVAVTEKKQGTAWLDENAKARAAAINDAVRRDSNEDEDENSLRFNSTKVAPWKRWLVFLGLGISMPKGDLYPYPAPRLVREINRARAAESLPDRFEIEPFMNFVATRMPYFDGGRLFQAATEQIRLPPLGRRLSLVLSGALRDLHDDKRLKLETIGDAKQSYSLTGEPHTIRNVAAVQLTMDAAHG